MITRREILEAVRAGAITPEAAYARIAALATGAATAETDLTDLTDRTDRAPELPEDGIAVIGMAGRFPGAADVGEYWRNLCEGRDSVGEVPSERWDHAAYYSPDPKAPGKCATKWGGFLADADKFDPLFFNLSPREAERMDPQQRLFLQEAWKAFEDAGCADERLQALKCGVFVGCKDGDYRDRLRAEGTDAYGLMGNDSAILSARIAYHLNLRGPAISVDTACSSSAVALHLACESLRSGACELALAGGAVLMTSPESFVTLSRLNAFSATGRCRAFAAGADGFVPAEAVAAVVLKPLAAARRDGDRIYGVIRGTAINQDGRSNGITAPSAPAQTALIRELYDRLKLDPTTIGYIETHGTGTALGDPIEVEGLTQAFRHYTDRRGFCALGAVKSNTGHPMLASGVSALIKVLLCLRHRELVPSLHFDAPNPHIDFEGSPFFVNTRRQAWAVPAGAPRRAGLSSFGFSGTNVHLVVEEAPAVRAEDGTYRADGTDGTYGEKAVRLYAFSAKTTEALVRRAAELAAWLRRPEGAAASAADIAWTLGAGRTHLVERAAVVAESKAELLGVLDRVVAEGVDSAAWRRGAPAPESERGELTARAETLAADGRALRPGEARKTLESLAALYGRGASLPWRIVTAGGRTISLPAYPFARERHWIEWPARKTGTEDRTYGANGTDGTYDRERAGGGLNFYTTRWEPVEGGLAVAARGPGTVVWRWSGGAGGVAERVRAAAEAARGVVARIAAERPGTTRRLVVLAESATPAADPVADFLGGWVRSLRMVLPRVVATLVRATPEEAARAEKAFDREDDPKGREEDNQPGSSRVGAGLAELRCEGGRIWRRVAERIELGADAGFPEGKRLRKGGVYVIAGGLGGVGRRVARHLLERYGARLLLIGRSEAGAEHLAELSGLGGEVLYRRADLTRPAELQAALSDARARFGRLHGVIHAAGVAASESVLERSDENLAAVLGPKVAGTLALHAATAADELDFFAVFSSTAAVLGDFGQCDYAGANAFLDGFAAWREGERAAGRAQGSTVSFGWPLWREGGMHFGGATEREYLRTSGLAYLESGDGLAALERGLAAGMTHVVVMPGETARADRALGLGDGAERAERAEDRTYGANGTDGTYGGAEAVRGGVLAAVARVLKLDAARVEVNRGLGEYGFDSINLKELADELAGDFGVEVSPAVFFARNTVAALTEHLVGRGVKARAAAEAEAEGAGDRTDKADLADQTDRIEDAGRPEPIAVIGLAGAFPGAADAREFWANLVAGKDSIREVPAERWDWREYFEAGATGEGPRAASKWGGFIEGADRFDARFFNLSPLEAQLMDPQQRLFLQTAWHALEDAAVAPSSLAGRRVGVFAGAQFNDYDDLLALAGERRPQRVTGCAHSVLANRVSYWLNLRGPSEAIDTACSSGLVAVNRAVRALRAGECELALAGAVCLILSPENMVGASKLGVLSPDGRCRTFGKGANGFVKGEGVGVLVLKPLSRALADGDPVHAVIRASGVNHGGRAHSLTAPNPVAQAELVETVYREAGVPVESIGYVEAHGTGTELGDPTEVEGLRAAFAALADRSGPATAGWCGLGSVKTNIGHLEPAAGIAGMMKVIFALRHGVLPASLHAAEPNPFLKLEGSPFAVVRETRAWSRARKADGSEWPRRAGVSAFGFGGANGHVLLEEYVPRAKKDRTERSDWADLTKGAAQVIVLSARNEERLRATGRRLAAYLRKAASEPDAPELAEVAYTLQVGRDAMETRWATVAASVEDAVERIEGWLAGGEENGDGTNRTDGTDGAYAAEEAWVEAWLRGEAVDWRAAWGGRAPTRVSLPGYAFAEDRHWFTAALRKEAPKAAAGAVGGETKETMTLSATDWLLRDHRVAGVPTLPAAGSLALACQAGAERLGGRVEELRDMVWLERAQAAGGRALELRLRVTTSEAATARFEVTAGGEGTPRYAEGRAQAKAEAGAAPRLDLAAIRARCGGRLDGAAAYAGLEARGMSFGPAFRTLKEIAAGQGEALATLALPAEARGWAGEVNPALLDGALQAIAGVAAKTESAETLLPFSLGRLRIWGQAMPAAVAHVVERPVAAGAGLRKFDIGVASEDGTVFWELRDLAVRIQKPDSKPAPGEAVTLEFFERRWLPAPANPVQAGGWLTVLALDEDAALAELLGRHVAVRRVVRVRTGRSFAQLGWELYAVRPDAPEDWRALYRALDPKAGEHWGVVNAWGAGKGFVPSAAALRPQVRKALYPCVGWVQAWLGNAARPTLRWVQLAASGETRPAQAAMTGMLATLAQEQPAFSGCVLERNGADLLETVATRCVAEWSPGGAGGGRVRYADGVRTVERFAAMAGPAASGGLAASLRPGGVYVLAGGLGGIGRALARAFVAAAGARLVLLGRGADGAEARERLRELRDAGAEVLACAVDLADGPAVAAALAKAREKFGALHGVVQCAGVTRDRLVQAKTADDFDAVLAPKVDGTVWLDAATRGDALDFFVVCSSMAGVTGNVGQADYAYANAFLDHWAEWRRGEVAAGRRSGKTLSVAWPLWAEGGMKVEPRAAAWMREKFGLVPLPTELGLRVLADALAADAGQVVLLAKAASGPAAATARAEEKTQAKRVEDGPYRTYGTHGTYDGKPDGGAGKDRLEAYLKTVLAKETGLAEAEIEAGAALERYGIDSLLAMGLTRALERDFGELPKTLFFEYQTLAALAAYLRREHAAAVARVAGGAGGEDAGEREGRNRADPTDRTDPTDLTDRTDLPDPRERTDGAIAIVGLSGRFPMAEDIDALWANLKAGKDCITEIPAERWDWRVDFDPVRGREGKTYAKWGGFLDDADKFDSLFFSIAPREAETMDPQERIFLEEVWKTLENAGYARAALAGRKVGVFVGVMYNQYQLFAAEEALKGNPVALGSSASSIANRVSYVFDWHGPSLALDTMCSSSLTALHLACESLRRGEIEAAVAGGVNLSIHPQKYLQLGFGEFASSDGRCRSFGEGGDGYVPGEGVGAVLLKPLGRAVADGDRILGVIRGSAVNHGGKTNGYSVPNPVAQGEVVADALRAAGVNARELSYVEAHGTGTALGDPIELAGLVKAFGRDTAERGFCALGSVKSNLGHMESAAGMAGLAKVLLQMRHGELAPTIHAEPANPNIRFADTPFVVQTRAAAWARPVGGGKRVAGISSFGAGGANAHVIVEEWVEDGTYRADRTDGTYGEAAEAVVVSAFDEERLREVAGRLAAFLDGEGAGLRWRDVAFTLQVGRTPLPERLGLVAKSAVETAALLRGWLEGKGAGVTQGNAKQRGAALVAGPAGARYVAALWAEGDLATLVRLWTTGAEIDWAELRSGETARRVALPAYPFKRVRHWVPGRREGSGLIPARAGGGRLHPLVHRNESDFREQRFVTNLDEAEPVLADHRVLGGTWLSAVAMLEMARWAAERAGGRPVTQLYDLVWERAVAAPDAANLALALGPTEDGAAFVLRDARDETRRFAGGRAGGAPVAPAAALNLAEIEARCPRLTSGAELYAECARHGVEYGAFYRSIEGLRVGEGEALAWLARPAGPDEAAGLDLSMLDGALQSVGALLRSGSTEAGPFVPFALERVELHAAMPARAAVAVRRAAGVARGSSIQKFDLTITDPEGTVCVVLKGLALRMATPVVADNKAGAAALEAARPDRLTGPASGGGAEAKAKDNAAPLEDDGRASLGVYLRGLVAAALKVEPARIAGGEPLDSYGFDSVLMMRLTRELERDFGALPKTLFFEHRSLDELAGYFAAEHGMRVAEHFGVRAAKTSVAPAPVPPGTVAPVRATLPGLRRETLTRAGATKGGGAPAAGGAIAIVGLAGRYPEADTLEQFWANLRAGRDSIAEVPAERWDHAAIFDPTPGKPGKTYSKWGGWVRDVDKFDPLFFAIAPREAEFMDPQERLFLQTAWHACEDAGLTRAKLAGRKAGVFVGVMYGQYQLVEPDAAGVPPGTSFASIANRVSYFLDLQGPSLAVDTMCSSSLTALHLACESLRRGESELAIAGGVNLTLHPNKYLQLSHGRFASTDGRCRAFGAEGDGYVPGEGVGAVVLKPLAQAEADGDLIYGVLRATTTNHGGRTNGYSVPNPAAQARVVGEALAAAGVDPADISYVEAHGTGTALGDPVEIRGLTKAFEAAGPGWRCALGSVKSNIGHLESAAGMAALTKVLLQMRHRELVPSLHAEALNPHIDFAKTPFAVQRELAPWESPELGADGREGQRPRLAGISSFGAGGANAHVIVEEYAGVGTDQTDWTEQTDLTGDEAQVVVISARNAKSLRALVEAWVDFLAKTRAPLSGIAASSQLRREPMAERLAVCARTVAELRAALTAWLAGGNAGPAGEAEIFAGRVQAGAAPAAGALVSGEEGAAFLRAVIAQRSAVKLAQLWTGGVNIDWSLLYLDEPVPAPVRLPLYVFARDRYWLGADGVRVRVGQAEDGTENGTYGAHGTDRTYAEETLKAEVVAGGEEGATVRIAVGAGLGFVRDHVVGGRRLLPGVACLELVRRALAAAWPGAAAGEWRHLVWAAPLEVPDAGADLWIELRRKPGRREFTLETRVAGGGRIVHVQGRVAEEPATAGAVRLDIEALRARCPERVEGEEVYRRFAEIGFAYGPAMQAVEFIQVGPGEALARLATAPEAGIAWTPALLDGALQAVLGAARTDAEASDGQAKSYLPFSAGEIWLASGALPARAWAHIVAGTEDANTRRYQIAVCDDAGEVRVRLKDFTVRAAAARPGETAVPENGAGPGPEVAAYVPEWVEQALPETAEAEGSRKVVLVASEDEAWLDGARRAGAAAARLPADEAAWAAALAAAAETWGLRVSQVILDGRGEAALRPEWVAAAKALLRARGPMHLTIAGTAGDGDAVAGLGGFARTVQAEAPTLRMTLLGLVGPTVETVLAAARAETDAPVADIEVRRDAAGLRRVRRWREATWPATAAAWRAGTYLITGGAGGLGRIFAAEAARWPGVRVVLVGRSPENEDIAAWLRGLRAGGARIEYRSCDLARSEAVASLVRTVRAEGGPIRGVVHAAGVLRDRLLTQKGWADFEAVLAPKVAGARHLDEALADEELDFFAVFSSTAGALGNPGQADYAAANGALDAFARTRASEVAAGRRQGRTVSFNWPYWREGGMRIDARTLGWIEQETGLRPLETSAGLAAFAAGLAGMEPQVMVLAGDQPRIRKALGLAERRPEAAVAKPARPVAWAAKAESGAMKASPVKETAAELVARVERELAGITAELLKVPVTELDPQVELGEYGMDSIAMMTMLNRIEALHDCTLDPNVIASQGTLGRLARHLVETGVVRAGAGADRTDKTDRTDPTDLSESAGRREQVATTERAPATDGRIAVVAMACRFPRSPSLEAYWENLREGRNLISEIPPDRWDVERFYSTDKKAPQRAYSKWGGFMDGVDLFDAKYFGVSDQDAALMDPQQRHLLELTQELFDRAGYRRAELDGTRTGVFVGGGQSAYLAESRRIPESHMKHRVVGMIQNMMAARVADFFNLKGPAQTIDTACSSSLVALHFACQSLLAGDCELAVVGGAELLIDPYQFVGFSKAEVLSDDGQCYVFDERAKGIVLGEGAGVVLLKPYARAVADGDIICGVIRGSAINNDGRTMGLTVPSQEGQKDVIRRALEKSGVSAATIGYLEAHGTGTLLGDPIEIRAATQVFAEAGAERQVCAVGSVKSNMGHLVRAAGIASFIKVMLALRHRTIPATINCARPHPRFKFGESPFYPVTATRPWAELAGVRRAGISSFGFGGTNCHVVVEEHVEAPEKPGATGVVKGKDLAGAAGLERELNALSQ